MTEKPANPAQPTLPVFPADLPIAGRLAVAKVYLAEENIRLRQLHDDGGSGRAVAQARSVMIDRLLQALFEHAVASYIAKHGPLPSPVVLIALGGYGRAELSPMSDVDIMFLFSAKA